MADLPPGDPGHGNTPAAWTGVGLILLGSLLVCLGLVLAQSWMWIIGGILVVAGALYWGVRGRATADPHASNHMG